MEPIRWRTPRVIDAHVHFEHDQPFAHFYDNCDLANCAKYCVLGLPFHAEQNEWLLQLKREFPQRFFVFGRLFHDPQQVARGDGRSLVPQVEKLLAAGFDGIKMWEGKPVMRKTVVPWRLDHAYYRPYWQYVAANRIPVTVHQGDAGLCWPTNGKPREHYTDGASFEAYIQETEALLDLYPGLKVCFAHFLWLSPHLERLGRLFTRHPELRVDLAMGGEYFYALSNAPEAGRAFLIQWQKRILYGTDLNDNNSFRLARAKPEMLRRFLETDEEFTSLTAQAQDQEPPVVHGRTTIRGLNLPDDALANIMAANFERFVGPEPKPLPGN